MAYRADILSIGRGSEVDADKTLLAAGIQGGWKAYVAGPPAMVDAVGALCREHGMRDSDFHADPFFTPGGAGAANLRRSRR